MQNKLIRFQYYYDSKKDDSVVVDFIQELGFKPHRPNPYYGFRKLFAYLRKSGKPWNHKKVYRIYKLLKLNKKRKGKEGCRKHPDHSRFTLVRTTYF
ncbi:transposase [Dyadobacter sp. UP-52]|uniref:Transposase n=1 Tax=Dyadobacter subterraneus TaxID=2773304 RepID=A0ABR9WE97_9BACT|nr:transposase [Dyadobacter subterraneus]